MFVTESFQRQASASNTVGGMIFPIIIALGSFLRYAHKPSHLRQCASYLSLSFESLQELCGEEP